MNKKILLTMILGMFLLLPIVSAESIGTFKQGTTLNITNYCRDGGCTGITLVSIKYPDGTTSQINEAMIMNGQTGYYEFSDTAQIGTYYFTTTGSNGITNTDSFEISGGNIAFFIIAFILFFGITFYGIKIKHEWVTLIGCFGLLILGIYTSFNGVDSFKNSLTDIISYVTIAIGLGVGFEALRKITYY